MSHISSRPASRAACGFAMLLLMAPGCGGYGEISHESYQYATALYSICNRRSRAELAPFREKLTAARDAMRLAEHEADWLTAIVELAEAGDWETARDEARRLLEDQVRGR